MAAKMNQTINVFHDSIRNIRTGTVTSSFVDTFKVPYFGQEIPIKHLASTISDGNRVMVKPYDPTILGQVQKTLKDAGLNAYVFSKEAVAVSIPPICGDEKERIKARVKHLGEDAKVSIRNIRKSFRNKLGGSQDEKKQQDKEIQALTDEAILMIEEIVIEKISSIG